MKIAQITPVFMPYRGGIGTMAYNHAVSMARAGHQVTVLTPRYDLSTPIEETMDGFTVKRVRPSFSFGNAAFCPSLLKELSDFDIVHLHYPFFGGAEIVYLSRLLKKMPKKLVVTYHMDVVGNIYTKLLFFIHSKILLPRIIKNADRVIVTSNDYAAHSRIRKLFYRLPNKFSEIPAEVDANDYSPGQDFGDLAIKYGIDKSKEKILLFVGGLDKAHYFKGVPFLLKTLSMLKKSSSLNFKCLIVGEGDLKKEFIKIAKDLELERFVIFAEPVSFIDLPRYYNLADALVLPSTDRSEAFGIVLLEAMSCGKPVIASALPGVRSVVGDGNGYTFSPKNEGELAGRIIDLLSDDEKLRKFGLEARQRVLDKYTREKVLEKLIEVYKLVISIQ